MSLMKTLTRVAIGIVVTKGVQHVTRRVGAGSAPPVRKAGTTRGSSTDTGSLGGIMDEIMGAGKASRRSGGPASGTGLDGLLGSLAGAGKPRSRKSAPTGGLQDLLGGSASGGLGGLLGAVLGGGTLATSQPQPQAEDEAEAALVLRAMIMAAKADGQLDAAEKARLLEAAGDASRAEIEFINAELAAPLDLDSLLAQVPRGLEEKVYMASVMAINLDDRAEAEYLHMLAQGLGLSEADVNALHDHLQAPRIYG